MMIVEMILMNLIRAQVEYVLVTTSNVKLVDVFL